MSIKSFFRNLFTNLMKKSNDDSVIEGDDKGPSKDDIKKCLDSWQRFKEECNNSYVYIEKTGSVTKDFYYETQITVEKGKVTKAYKTKRMRDSSEFEKYLKKEDRRKRDPITEPLPDKQIRLSDEQTRSLTNLDMVYQFIEKLPNISSQKNYIIFWVDNRGLVICAGFSPKGCVDNCFKGHDITSLTPLKA